MSSKGESKIQKRLAAPKALKIKRKSKQRYLFKARAGPHPKKESIPLGVLLRETLGLVKTKKEAVHVLKNKQVLIDGRTVKDYKYPVGFMDIISLPSLKQNYRIEYDHLGRLSTVEVGQKESTMKLCKVTKKTASKKGTFQYGFHDGRSKVSKKDEFRVGDVVGLEVPGQKILAKYPMKTGALAYITRGGHAGTVGTITNIVAGGLTKKPVVEVESPKGNFETLKEYVFVIGDKKPAIKIGEQ